MKNQTNQNASPLEKKADRFAWRTRLRRWKKNKGKGKGKGKGKTA